MRPFSALFLSSSLLTLAACATTPNIDPAPEARAVSGPGEGAVAEAAHIEVEAREDAWEATPRNLSSALTPILVQVTNNSGQAVRIRYQEFRLVEGDGDIRAAVPAFDIEGEAVQPVEPYYPHSSFYVAPHLGSFYHGFVTPYHGSFRHSRGYHGTHFGTHFADVDLPSADMVARALPEGVVEPGGKVTGFVYFQPLESNVQRVSFQLDLVEAVTTRELGQIRIPFVEE